MKKLRIVLPAVAFVFAIAFSFASVRIADAQDEGTFIQLENPQSCQEVTVDCGTTGPMCTLISGEQVYGFRDGTLCSEPLRRDNP